MMNALTRQTSVFYSVEMIRRAPEPSALMASTLTTRYLFSVASSQEHQPYPNYGHSFDPREILLSWRSLPLTTRRCCRRYVSPARRTVNQIDTLFSQAHELTMDGATEKQGFKKCNDLLEYPDLPTHVKGGCHLVLASSTANEGFLAHAIEAERLFNQLTVSHPGNPQFQQGWQTAKEAIAESRQILAELEAEARRCEASGSCMCNMRVLTVYHLTTASQSPNTLEPTGQLPFVANFASHGVMVVGQGT